MRYAIIFLSLSLTASVCDARGLLIPSEPDLPPLAMLNHLVNVEIEDQVAVTRVRQTFRNHTDTDLEATYVFPVPEGASIRGFKMWIDGKQSKGELLKADEAKDLYTKIVRQTKNPALLDYIGSDLLRLRIFPVPAKGDQTVEVSFTAVAKRQHSVVEYVYPLKSDRTAANTLEEFKLELKISGQQPISNIYSPTHDVVVVRPDDHSATVRFEQTAATLDRDFQLFYTNTGEDIGLTTLQHRPISDEDGYVMFLMSPRPELADTQKVPRDIVFVVDTSGSMNNDNKIQQAKSAMAHCLGKLTSDDRFAVVSFATTVDLYRDKLVPATSDQVSHATEWVNGLYAGGGTAIDGALTTALGLRDDEKGRMFTVVFVTDGQPTIGETDTEKILTNLRKNNSSATRIFTLGLGENLNAVLLDKIAEDSRALSTYVGTEQNIQQRVATFFEKIHHPVLANLEMTTEGDTRLVEIYPPRLPDLFHGDQLVLLARYQGQSPTEITIRGHVGVHEKSFSYDVDFASKTDSKGFVEELWARRKVGYLLDQIRTNGEQKELVDEVVRLAKNYGITTPYTSYLIMPDTPTLVASRDANGQERMLPFGIANGFSYRGGAGGVEAKQQSVKDFADLAQKSRGDLAKNRGLYQDWSLKNLPATEAAVPESARPELTRRYAAAQRLKSSLDQAHANFAGGQLFANQVDALGIDLATCTNGLKCQNRLEPTAVRRVASRNCMELGGVWVDEGYTSKIKTVSVKSQSDAYFEILATHPEMKEVFKLGNYLVWITPSGTGLIIDENEGREMLNESEIAAMFASK